MKMIIKKKALLGDRNYQGSHDWNRIRSKSLVIDLREGYQRMIDPMDAQYGPLYDEDRISKTTASRDALVTMLGAEHKAAIDAVMIRKFADKEIDLQAQAPGAEVALFSNSDGIGMGNAELAFDIIVLNEEGEVEWYSLTLSASVMTHSGSLCAKGDTVAALEFESEVDASKFKRFLMEKGPVRLNQWLKDSLESGCYAVNWSEFDTWVEGSDIMLMGLYRLKACPEGVGQEIMVEVKPSLVPILKTYDSPRVYRDIELPENAFENGSEDWPRIRSNMSVIVADEQGDKSYVDIMSPEYDVMFKGARAPSATRDGLSLMLGGENKPTVMRTITKKIGGVDCDLQLQALGADALEMGIHFGFESITPMDNYYYVFEIDADKGLRVHTLMLAPAAIDNGERKVVGDFGVIGKTAGFKGTIGGKALRCFIESKSPEECIDWLEQARMLGFKPHDWECFTQLNPGRFSTLLASVSQLVVSDDGKVMNKVMAELNPKVVENGLKTIVSAPKKGGSVASAASSVASIASDGFCAAQQELIALSMFAKGWFASAPKADVTEDSAELSTSDEDDFVSVDYRR